MLRTGNCQRLEVREVGGCDSIIIAEPRMGQLSVSASSSHEI